MGSPSRDIFTAWQTLIATLLWGLQLNNTVTQCNVQRKHERIYRVTHQVVLLTSKQKFRFSIQRLY